MMIFNYRSLALIAGLFAGVNGYVQAQQNNNYIDIGTPVTNPASKPGWNLVFQDEFNNTKSSAWNNGPVSAPNHYVGTCWGNSHPQAPGYARDENQTLTATSLKLTTKKENYTPDPINKPMKPYTAGMLNSDNCAGLEQTPQANHLFQYGYFEIRCKNPKGQKLWPAFWLMGGSNAVSHYNEIDIFEFGVSDVVVLTNHYENANHDRIFPAKWIHSLPGQTFGDTWVTYAMKWEPNKIVWYINNVPVRIETSATSVIPTIPMYIIANSGLSEFEAGVNGYLPKVFPNDMEIDYIRVYQRSNHASPDLVFSINGRQSTSPTSPISTPSTSIFLDGSQSYMPSHDYIIYIQRCDANGNTIGSDYGRGLSAAEVAKIDHFDLRTYALNLGLVLIPGYNYRVKLASNAPWTELSQFITVTNCTTSINFKTNGTPNTTFPTPITINQNNGKPRVILDCSASVSCNEAYTVSVQLCNSLGTGTGTIYTKTLTAAEQKYLSGLDLEYVYAQAGGGTLTPGNRYLVKVSSGSPLVTQSQVIYIAPCTTTTNFTINGANLAFPNANTISNGVPIILDASGNTVCETQMTVVVVKCNSSGTAIGTGITDTWDFAHYDAGRYFYYAGNYSIRELCQRKSFLLECGNYYRIQLMTPSSATTKIIYIASCPFVFNDYKINNIDVVENYMNINQDVYLHAPDAMSCTDRFFVSVQKRQSGVLVGPEAMAWLTPMQKYHLRETGGFDLKTFAQDPNADGNTSDGFTLQNNTTYKVKLVADAGGCNADSWNENSKIIYFGTGSGKPAGSDESVSLDEASERMTFAIYPNPTSGKMTIVLPENSEQAVVTFLDLTGKTIHTATISSSNQTIDGQAFASGVYYVRCQTSSGIFTQKVEIRQ